MYPHFHGEMKKKKKKKKIGHFFDLALRMMHGFIVIFFRNVYITFCLVIKKILINSFSVIIKKYFSEFQFAFDFVGIIFSSSSS